jgi:predicted MFS family arabinose efflux permease
MYRLLLLCAGNFVAGAGSLLPVGLLPLMVEDLGTTPSGVGHEALRALAAALFTPRTQS